LITNAGLVLRASNGAEAPAPELAQRVTDYVADKQQRSEGMDDMVTGELLADDVLTSLVQAAGVSYELLPLGCVVDSISTLVGVAVVQINDSFARNDKQAQLLNALATNLLQTGDSPGLPITPRD
jgi:hypothetical protein